MGVLLMFAYIKLTKIILKYMPLYKGIIMEESIKYKKCPFCELNYIPITDYCCEMCFANCKTSKKEVSAQKKKIFEIKKNQEKQRLELIRKRNLANKESQRTKKAKEIHHLELIRKRNLVIKQIQERKNRTALLNLWKNFNFIGFLHTTNFSNFINIYKSNFLKSRNQLISENIIFEDNAETSVLEKTWDPIKSNVRLYYRPITPTNISAFISHNQKNPVLIVFDECLLFENDIIFCDGCAGSHLTKSVKTAKKALSYDWEKIFSIGPFDRNDLILKNHRNAEFLITSPVSLENATKFYFRNYKDYIKACELLGNDIRFEHNPKLFY